MRTLLLCFTCIGSFCISLHAKTYYLDAMNGNDAFPGTSAQPWKTLSKSIAEAISSDSVFIMNGNYGAYIENRGSTNRSNWITYIASSGQTAVIIEYIQVTGIEVDAYLHFEGIDIFIQRFEQGLDIVLVGFGKLTRLLFKNLLRQFFKLQHGCFLHGDQILLLGVELVQ